MKTFLSMFLLGLLLSGCGDKPVEVTEATGATDTARKSLHYADHHSRQKNVRKKYFLIAGGRNDANFAQEIIEQRRWLLSRGVEANEVVCFYTIPFDTDFLADEDQYRSLASELGNCYPAYPKFVWEQLADGAPADDHLYFYVSSHGAKPLAEELDHPSVSDAERSTIKGWLAQFPDLNQFMIMLDATADGSPANFANRVEILKQRTDSFSNLFFTPKLLQKAISAAASEKAVKTVVIQGCYSGGFTDPFASMPNTVVMTASRRDRSSFGCGSGNWRTFFGGTFTDELVDYSTLPHQRDWNEAYLRISARIDRLEKELNYTPSQPEFLQVPPELRPLAAK